MSIIAFKANRAARQASREDDPSLAKSKVAKFFGGLALIIVILITLFPIYWMFRTAFSNNRSMFAEPEAFDAWASRWLALVGEERGAVADRMDRVNPIYIPRNHIVEEVLTAASWGDHDALTELLDVVTHPFEQRPGLERFAQPAPDAGNYRTFCGT